MNKSIKELSNEFKGYLNYKKHRVFDVVKDSDGVDQDGILYINTDLPIEHESCLAYKDKIKTIILGDKVQVIGKSAFENYTNLETVCYSPNLHTIGKFAFSGCTKLQDFLMDITPLKTTKFHILDDWNHNIRGCCIIREDLKNIEQDAFSGTGFEGIAVYDDGVNFRSGAFENCPNLEILWAPDCKDINFGVSSFSNCPKLMVNVNTDGIKRIAKYAFSGTKFAELIASNQIKYPADKIEPRITPTRIKTFKKELNNKKKNSPMVDRINTWLGK